MKTKFVKVSVSERLPKEETNIIVILDNKASFNAFRTENDYWYTKINGRLQDIDDVEFWLEEVPDREDEMREMLNKVLEHDPCHYSDSWDKLIKEVEKTLNELKQQ